MHSENPGAPDSQRVFAKLIGANVVIVAVAVAVHSVALRERNDAEIALMLAALAAASAVNYFLVRVALRPVEHLEEVAERVRSAGRGSDSRAVITRSTCSGPWR